MKAKVFAILRQYAMYQTNERYACKQRNYWLLKRLFKDLKINYILRAGAKTQLKFVSEYRDKKKLESVFRALK